MKKLLLILFFLISFVHPLYAQDMREAAVMAREALNQTMERDQQRHVTIKKNKQEITQHINILKTKNQTFSLDNESLKQRIALLQAKNQKLAEEMSQGQADLDELSGAVRVSAVNLKAILTESMYSAGKPARLEKLALILDTNRFPGIDDIKMIANLFMEEARLNGGIQFQQQYFISDAGQKVRGDVLVLGGFTSAYRLEGKTGFLNHSRASNNLYALSVLPSRSIRRNLNHYMDGKTDLVYIDISRGGALRQIIHQKNLKDHFQEGGFLVWPILALGILALIISLERFIFLRRVHDNADKVMGKVNQLAAQGDWKECDKIVGEKKIPVYNVLRSGLVARSENRETLESILQEAILKELPKLERFLPMLNIMGAIAPLLGLLGTVTGMIATFHVITLYGTGDPRMMAGGISIALVTTMFGLGVAIPIMLAYTFLCRKVEHVIGDMEEKAVALTNIIFRNAA